MMTDEWRGVTNNARIVSVVPREDDLLCLLEDGHVLAVDWRQAWTYRRLEDGDDALAIARRALELAPDLFSPARSPSLWVNDPAGRRESGRSIPFLGAVRRIAGQIATRIGWTDAVTKNK